MSFWILCTGASLGGFARAISTIPYLPSTFPKVDAQGCDRVISCKSLQRTRKREVACAWNNPASTAPFSCKGASEWERPSVAKFRNSWQWQTALSFLISECFAGASSQWLGNFRRVAMCYEHYLENFPGFVKLVCIVILLRHYC